MPQIVIASLETAFNRFLALDPEAAGQLGALEGRVICLHISGLDLKLYLFPAADEVMILEQFDGEADTTITGTPLALLRLGLASHAQAEMFAGDVTISGDLRLGRQFNKIIAELDIDWEALAARGMGDMAARTLGNVARSLYAWQQRSIESMRLNTGEYLQEEIRYLPGRNEIDAYLGDVDKLRDDVARFEARLKRLQSQLHNTITASKKADKKGTD